MQLTSKTPGLDEKLDGLLSLLMHEYEDQPAIAMGGFYDRYGEFFGDELHNLQEILFEDGLVRLFCRTGRSGTRNNPKRNFFHGQGRLFQ